MATIPRILHQTWKDAHVPPAYARYQASWLEHNRDWEYRFWTDEAARRFVAERDPDFLPVYDAYHPAIKRVDAARYLWMFHVGGVYADLDFECLRPLGELCAGRQVVLGLEPAVHGGAWIERHGLRRIVGNAFIASAPGHAFWAHVRRALIESRDVEDPLLATGPFFLTRALASFARAAEITLFEADVLYPATKAESWAAGGDSRRLRLGPNAVAVHHFLGSWWRGDEATRAAATPEPTVLVATPVKDARAHLPGYLERLAALDYPPERLSLAFLESDSRDGSFEWLAERLPALRERYRRVELHKLDFGFHPDRPRWASELQRQRRGILARSRNQLCARSLRDEDWVLWLDADVVRYPGDALRRLLASGKSIVVPHCLGQDGRTFDLNTFRLAEGVSDESRWLEDGFVQPPRGQGRLYLDAFRGRELVPVDAVGGTMLLVRADLHREGLVFPAAPYRGYLETEGLAVLARDLGVQAWGMPGLEIVHA